MGWIAVAALAALSFVLLWRIGKTPRGTWEAIGAALLLGVAGYALQGSPAQPGAPREGRKEVTEIDPALVEQRRAMMGRFGSEAQWLDTADTYGRLGSTRAAVGVMQGAVKENPNSADLWVGLGNALVNHADGMMTPAAQFAFQRAATISPEHPGPPFFIGLSLAQTGQVDRASAVWRDLLARTPPQAPWRADLEMRLAQIGGAPPLPAPVAPAPIERQSTDAAAGSNEVGATDPIANAATP